MERNRKAGQNPPRVVAPTEEEVSHPRFSKHLPQQLLNYFHFSKIMALKSDTMQPVKCHQVEVKTVYY
jgi:hypothetical protein